MDDMLSSILNDPEKLQSAISMASSMLGGGAPAAEEAQPGDVVIIRTRDGRIMAGEYFPCASAPTRPARKRRRMGRVGEFPEEPPAPAIELRLLEDRRRRERFTYVEVLQILKVLYITAPK